MIAKSLRQTNSDIIGAFASSLCLIHCLATPFIFIAHAGTAACCADAPSWWKGIDLLFIGVSFFAVYWSTKNSSKPWMVNALWVSWIGLCLVIGNEKLHLLALPESIIYVPAIALVVLHLYNKKYCQCDDDQCCTSKNKTYNNENRGY
ncbi:MAG: MerC domain-containing protein [Bacteroidota bacterium]